MAERGDGDGQVQNGVFKAETDSMLQLWSLEVISMVAYTHSRIA